jgi:amidase
MALPTAPSIAPPLDLPDAAQDDFRTRVMRLTCIAGLSGLPQMSIPVGTANGCPAGLSLIGWAGGDEALSTLPAAFRGSVGSLDARLRLRDAAELRRLAALGRPPGARRCALGQA